MFDVSVATLRHGASAFLDWWLGELKSLLPQPILRVLTATERRIEVSLDEGGLILTRHEGDSTTRLGRLIGGDNGAAQAELRRIIAAHQPPQWRWGFFLPDGVVLRDLIRIPAAAAENFREAVESQIEQQTPFRRTEVYTDCRLLPAESAVGPVTVEFIVVRRSTVDAALQKLAAFNLPVSFVTADFDRAAGAQFNLLPDGAARRPRAIGINTVLAATAAILAGLMIYLPMDHDHRQAAALSARVAQLRAEANVASRLRDQIEAEQRGIRSILNQKRETPSIVRVLNDLSRLLPDETWVSQLDVKEGTVRAVMHAPESGSVVGLVEGSGPFTGVKMVTAVRRQANSAKEEFTLSFTAGPRAGDAPAAKPGAGR